MFAVGFTGNLILIGLSLFVSGFATPALAQDQLANAMQLYNQQNYAAAMTAVQAELKILPANAAAHYLAGLILTRTGAVASAKNHFQDAVRLEPTSSAAAYSKRELALLSAPLAVQTVRTASAGAAVDPEVKKSVTAISRETDEAIHALEAERTSDVARIKSESDKRLADLNDAMENDMQASGRYVTKSLTVVHNLTLINQNLRDDYLNRIARERFSCGHSIEIVNAEYQRRIDDLNESATRTEKSFLDSDAKNTAVRLMPQNSDLHVHNFQTQDQPSGYVPALMATPAKIQKARQGW